MIEPHSVSNDLEWEAVTLIQGLRRSGAPHERQPDSAIKGRSWACPVQDALDRITWLEVAKKLRRWATTDSFFLAQTDLWLDSQLRLAKVDRLKSAALPRGSTIPSLPQERTP